MVAPGSHVAMNQRVLARVVRPRVPGKQAQVAHRLVRCVQESELHEFVQLDVLDELHPDRREVRPTTGKLSSITTAGSSRNARAIGPRSSIPKSARMAPRVSSVAGRHAVHHRAGEGHLLLDPLG